MIMPQTLHVHSRVKDYNILFTDDVLTTLGDCLGERKQRKLLFLTDQTVYDLYHPSSKTYVIAIPPLFTFVHQVVNPNPGPRQCYL